MARKQCTRPVPPLSLTDTLAHSLQLRRFFLRVCQLRVCEKMTSTACLLYCFEQDRHPCHPPIHSQSLFFFSWCWNLLGWTLSSPFVSLQPRPSSLVSTPRTRRQQCSFVCPPPSCPLTLPRVMLVGGDGGMPRHDKRNVKGWKM